MECSMELARVDLEETLYCDCGWSYTAPVPNEFVKTGSAVGEQLGGESDGHRFPITFFHNDAQDLRWEAAANHLGYESAEDLQEELWEEIDE